MVCAEGLRVWRSFKNCVNQWGERLSVGALCSSAARRGCGRRDRSGMVGHPSTVPEKRWIMNLIHQMRRKPLSDSILPLHARRGKWPPADSAEQYHYCSRRPGEYRATATARRGEIRCRLRSHGDLVIRSPGIDARKSAERPVKPWPPPRGAETQVGVRVKVNVSAPSAKCPQQIIVMAQDIVNRCLPTSSHFGIVLSG